MTMVARPTSPSEAPDQPSCCQIVDTVHDAKVNISRELDVIRDRRNGLPHPRDVIDRSNADARRAYATAYVDGRITAGHASGTDRETWTGLVDEHLTPAPENRLWLVRRNARREVPLRLVDPLEVEASAARRRAHAAFRAWCHLNGVGLAGDGEPGDLVSEALADDLDRLPAVPSPQRVVIVTTTTGQDGQPVERRTQAELRPDDDYPGGSAA